MTRTRGPRPSSAAREPASLISEDVRRHNISLVLEHIVAQGPSARSDIAEGTGLSRGAVTALVAILTDAGILREAESVSPAGKGRPRVLLELAADSIALIVAQVDADRVIAVVTDLAGNTLARFENKHGRPMGEPAPILDQLAAVIGSALETTRSLGRTAGDLTVVAFAPVSGDPAVVVVDTDLRWGRVDVIGGLRSRLDSLPASVSLVSDVFVSAAAEKRLLPQVGDLIYLKSNSGIGGALITGGRLVEGGHDLAGALGHIAVDYDGAQCECGQRGCLVTVAGPDVLLEKAGLGDVLRSEGLTVALAEFVASISSGDERAREAWSIGATWVARALQILTLTIDPEVIVLGGYWQHLVDDVERVFRRNRPVIPGLSDVDWVRIVPGALGDDAALLGALWNARDRLIEDPLTRLV